MDHQELFDRWVMAELGLIGEYSGNIAHDEKELLDEAEAYANEHGLEFHRAAHE